MPPEQTRITPGDCVHEPTETIWHNGDYKPWFEATTHVMTHALHYGSSVFEGIRVYEKHGRPVGFRMREHMQRLFDSARVYRIDIPYDLDTLYDACCGVVTRNDMRSAYLRPIAYRGYGSIGVAPHGGTPVEVAIAAIAWGAYLGEEAREKGARVCISSWQRAGAQHHSGRRQGRRQLPLQPAHFDGSTPPGL